MLDVVANVLSMYKLPAFFWIILELLLNVLDESNIDPSDVIPVPIFSNPPKLNEGVTELKAVILFVPPIRDNLLKLLEPLESLKASVLETAAVLYDAVTNVFNAIEFVILLLKQYMKLLSLNPLLIC